jgi:1-acyl-sn-glycerol-3-phosphate acyltransferase
VLRAVFSTVFIAVFTLVGSFWAFVLRALDPTGDRVVGLAQFWSRAVLRVAGVRVEATWHTDLDPRQPYVFMANHLSTVDIWALFVVLPFKLRMIAKKQLGRIPIFGWAMRAGRFIFIDRTNAVAARRSIDVAKERIRNGQSVLLFPEGTRSRDGTLGPFKKGGIHLAIDAGVPIVPIAISGSREAMPRGSLLLRSGVVRITIGRPIPTAGHGEGERNALLAKVREDVAALLAAQRSAQLEGEPAASHAH